MSILDRIKQIFLDDKRYILVFPVVLTVVLRLSCLGLPPFSDQGYYGTIALERVLTAAYHVNVYSYIAGLITGDCGNPLIAQRLFDMAWAALGGTFLLLVLRKFFSLKTSLIVAIMWIVINNSPRFVQGGFKNPIMAATAILLFSLFLIKRDDLRSCFISGMCICLAVMFRETFLFTAFAGLTFAYMYNKGKGVLFHFYGMCCCSILIVLFIACHDNLLDVIERYQMINRFYTYKDQVEVNGLIQYARMGKETFIMNGGLLLSALCVLIPSRVKLKESITFPVVAFWVLLLPFLPEILTHRRVTFDYHFLQLSLACCFLSALGIEKLTSLKSKLNLYVAQAAMFVLVLILFRPVANDYKTHIREAKQFAPVTIKQDWNNEVVNKSTYLLLSKKILEFKDKDDVMIVSGGMQALNLMTRTSLPGPRFVGLTYLFNIDGLDAAKEILKTSKTPTIVVESTRWPVNLTDLWPDFYKDYEEVYKLEKNNQRHYGYLGATIWRLKDDI